MRLVRILQILWQYRLQCCGCLDPTTESPAFDDINFSKPGFDLADIFGSIFNSGTFIPGSEDITQVGEIIRDILGSVILDGTFGQGSTVYEDVDGITRNEIMIIPDLFATLVSSANQSQASSASSTFIANPLPGSSINKKNHSGGTCTSDGRYDTSGALRNGPKHFGVDLGSGSANVSVGTPVLAAGHGNAVYANQPSKAGQILEIYHKFGFVSRYLHLDTTITTSRQNGIKAGIKLQRSEDQGTYYHVLKHTYIFRQRFWVSLLIQLQYLTGPLSNSYL